MAVGAIAQQQQIDMKRVLKEQLKENPPENVTLNARTCTNAQRPEAIRGTWKGAMVLTSGFDQQTTGCVLCFKIYARICI